jgi:uncharacterized protein
MLVLFAPFIVGLVGSLHCLGMCGPLVVAYSLHFRTTSPDATPDARGIWSKGFVHHLAFHSGRLLTYGLLGSLASTLAYAAKFDRLFTDLRSSVTLAGGLLMVLFGLALLKVIPLSLFHLPYARAGSPIARVLPRLFASERIGSKFILGLAAGCLPCMLSWAMIVNAAMTSSPAHGFMTMALFGLGTVPALFLTGLSASLLTLRVRLTGERLAACSVIIMGIMLMVKGAKHFA